MAFIFNRFVVCLGRGGTVACGNISVFYGLNSHLTMSFKRLNVLKPTIACYLAFLAPRVLSTSAYQSFRQPVYSTKTPYQWLLDCRNMNGRVESGNTSAEGCIPIHLNFLVRHGAREPGAKDVKKFSALGSKVKKQLKTSRPVSSKDEKFISLRKWKNRFEGNDKELVEIGRDEQFELGSRLGKRFKDVLMKFNTEGVQFVVSSKSRTKDSAVAFYHGIMPQLGRNLTSDEGMVISLSDETLRFFDSCEKYMKDVDNNDGALKEFFKFLESDVMTNIAQKVTNRLELRDAAITPAEVRTMFYLCCIETAFYNSSDWCSGLEEHDLPVLEYLMDLKHYWKKAYGYDINYLQSCPLTADILGSIKEAVQKYKEGKQYATAVFRFGHAETILPLYAILGLYKDEQPLRADNYLQQKNRKFLSSLICPFSANIGFIIYDCQSETLGEDRFALSVLVNEVPIHLPGCEEILCPLSKFQQLYSHISSCNFSDVCLSDISETSRDEL